MNPFILNQIEKKLEGPNVMAYLVNDHDGTFLGDITGEMEQLIKSHHKQRVLIFKFQERIDTLARLLKEYFQGEGE